MGYIPVISKFKYDFDRSYNLHIWYDDKEKGTVFTYNACLYTKETSFDGVKKEVEKFRSVAFNKREL